MNSDQGARIRHLEAALQQIADGKVKPRPDDSGWYSTSYSVRALAREALEAVPAASDERRNDG